MAEFELKALITGVDRLSPALSKMQKKIRGFKRQAEEASQGGLALGGGLAAGLTLSLKSYADQENAATGLKVAMMDANGEVGKRFQDINKLAIGLGNQLPGTTADFQNMMQMLVRQGIPAENILGGVGKATAYLAVQLKKTPEAAAEFAAKMQDATGTASEDMMGLFDTIQKAFYLGVDDTNMLSFFTKTSSVLKMVNKDGLQAAQSLAPISVMMDQMGMNGESAGNALRKVIQSGLSVKKIRDVNKVMARQKLGVQLDFTDGKGSFGGLDNMFRQLAKLRKLTDVKRTGVLKAIFGDDAETLQVVNALIDKGKDGYDQIQQKMNKQASLNKRVQAQLGTLSNLWEAMTGTATNGLAAIGGAFSGDAKNITQWLGELGEKFTKFADENPRVIRGVVGLAAGLAILKLGLMGVGSAISIVSRIMSMTPIGMIATAIALAAGLIITNWDVVGPYFKKLWETIGPYFEAGWELLKKVFAWSPLGMVINNWGPVVKWFQDMWDKLKPIIEWFTDSSGDTVDAINSAQWGAGAYDAYGTGIPARGYTPYPNRDKPYTEDLGKITFRPSITAYVVGDDCFDQRDRLIEALNKPGPGTLVHPTYGELKVCVDGEVRVSTSKSEGRIVRFDLKFVEAGELSYPTSGAATAQTLMSSCSALDDCISDSFSSFSIDGVADFVQNDVVGNASTMLGYVSDAMKVVDSAVSDAARLLQGDISVLLPPPSSGKNFVEQVQKMWRTGKRLYGNASDLVTMIKTLSGVSLGSDLQPRGVWKTDSKTTATATQQRNVVASTLRTTAISEAAYAVTRLPAPTTSAVMQNAAVGQATTPAQSTGWPSVTHPALNNAPAVKNTVDLPTWEELTDIRDTLNTAIDKELSRTTSDALFLALRRVKADLNADINTRLEQSARIIQRTPDEVLPALVLAATWFDNAARDADIIRRNAITHPGFVPVIPLKVPVQ